MQYFDEVNIDRFDFPNGFKCTDVYIFEKLTNESINKNWIKFASSWKWIETKKIPTEFSKNDSVRVVDLMFNVM